MKKFKKYQAMKSGWTIWICPKPKSYKLACCDCGLVHEFQFRVVEDSRGKFVDANKQIKGARSVFRVKRLDRATEKMREPKAAK